MSTISKLYTHVSMGLRRYTTTKLRSTTSPTSIIGERALEELRNLNQYTLDLYARRKREMKDKLGKEIPVILANQDRLTTLYGGTQSTVEYVPREYHALKAIAHVPIAIDTTREREDARILLPKLESLFRAC
jgi:hypothetical protein